MASNSRYREVVPPAVQQFEADNSLYTADWYIPSAANPGVYLSEFEKLFPGRPAGEVTLETEDSEGTAAPATSKRRT